MLEFFQGCEFEELKAAIKGEEFVAKPKTKTHSVHTSKNTMNRFETQLDNLNLNYYLNYLIRYGNKLKVQTNLHFDISNDTGDWEGLAS